MNEEKAVDVPQAAAESDAKADQGGQSAGREGDRRSAPAWRGKVRRLLVFLAKWTGLVILSLGSITSFLVNGWLVSVTRKGICDQWRSSARRLRARGNVPEVGTDTEAGCQALPSSSAAVSAEGGGGSVNTAGDQPGPKEVRTEGKHRRRTVIGRSWQWTGENFIRGLRNWFGVWVWTLPGLGLMATAWYAGWQVSFTKMYEYSAVGTLTGIAGMLCLTVTLPMVMMAMARYSVSGDWKVFFQARRNWRWVRRAGLRNISTAALFLIASLPVGVNYFAFYFWPDVIGVKSDWSPGQLMFAVNRFYFLSSLLLLMPVWVVTRYLLGRHLYAPVVTRWIRRKQVSADELTEGEWQTLRENGWMVLPPPDDELPSRPHALMRILKTIIPVGSVAATGLLWLAFSFLIFMAQFARYSGLEGWFNHPIIHNPHYHYAPQLDPAGNDSMLLNDNPAFRD